MFARTITSATTLLFLVAPLLGWGQEAWIKDFVPASAAESAEYRIRSAKPWGEGWMVAVTSNSPSHSGENCFGRLDPHGNLLWQLADKDPSPFGYHDFLPLLNGNLLFIQGVLPMGSSSLGANIFEIGPGGDVLSKKTLEHYSPSHIMFGDASLQLKDGDLLLIMNRSLLEYRGLFESLNWAKSIRVEPRHSGNLGELIEGVLENEDGTLAIIGKYPASGLAGGEYYRHFVATIDPDGLMLWFKTFDLDSPQYSVEFRSLLRVPSGGYWAVGGAMSGVGTPEYQSWPYIMRISPQGLIDWQRVYCIQDLCQGGELAAALPDPGGGVIVAGGADAGSGSWPRAFLLKVAQDGSPEWVSAVQNSWLPEPYFGLYFNKLFMADDGFLLPSDQSNFPEQTPRWIIRTDGKGEMIGTCSGLFYRPEATSQDVNILFPCSDSLILEPTAGYRVTESAADLVANGLVLSRTLCGEMFPAVTEIEPRREPFRLKVAGWNFQEGCKVLIAGSEVPASILKSVDATGWGIIAAGRGKRLKAMLPKGQPVCITVRNPDGNESVCFTYTR